MTHLNSVQLVNPTFHEVVFTVRVRVKVRVRVRVETFIAVN